MKNRWIFLCVALCSGVLGFAQVGLGTHVPNLSTQLHVSASDKGVLIPQVSLQGLTDQQTIKPGNVESLLVYNTNSNGELVPGYYFWKGTTWTRLLTSLDDVGLSAVINEFKVDNGVLTLTDTQGNWASIAIAELNILSTLVKDPLNNGKYTYTNEKGESLEIDVVGDVTENFQSIVNNNDVTDILKIIIEQNGGNVYYDGSKLTWATPSGDRQEIDLSAIVKLSETQTTLTNVDDVFTYVNEVGVSSVIDIPSLVKTHQSLTSLVNVVTTEKDEMDQDVEKNTLIYTDENGVEHPIDLDFLVKLNETITTLVYDPIAHVLTYTNENQDTSVLPLVDLVGDAQTLTKLSFDTSSDHLIYLDEDKVTHDLDLSSINKNPWYNSNNHQVATSNTADIYTKGWVGIGFTEPSSAPDEKLRVNGSITAVNSYYADYVFEKYFDGYSPLNYDYDFHSLETVEEFIVKNRHLPGITPIDDLSTSESGYVINVSELSIQLLEKTEELYLHLIDQNKELKQKEARIQDLEALNQSVLEKFSELQDKDSKIQELETANELMLEKLQSLEAAIEKLM